MIELQRPDALIWIRDTDGDRARIDGWKQACETAGAEFEVLIGGFPHECMEAWLIAAWSPTSPQDHAALVAERDRLKFDPADHPERLSHKERAPKSAKTVVQNLRIDPEQVLATIDLSTARSHGANCGLADFTECIGTLLIPRIR